MLQEVKRKGASHSNPRGKETYNALFGDEKCDIAHKKPFFLPEDADIKKVRVVRPQMMFFS